MRLKTFHFMCGIVLLALGCAQSLYFDAQGAAHGSGERDYNYKSGAIQLRETYRDGKLVLSRWFGTDGELLQASIWSDGTGERIYLREDGSIRARIQYVSGIAEGEALEYDEAGHITKVMYHAGRRYAGAP
jgi:antitoxin component YwqK of YwqJK toxin-antitoxin module